MTEENEEQVSGLEEQEASLEALLAEAEEAEITEEDEQEEDEQPDPESDAIARKLVSKGTRGIEAALKHRWEYLDLTTTIDDGEGGDLVLPMRVVAVEALTPLAVQLGLNERNIPQWLEKALPSLGAAWVLGGMGISIYAQVKAHNAKQEAETGPIEGESQPVHEVAPEPELTPDMQHEASVLKATPLGV